MSPVSLATLRKGARGVVIDVRDDAQSLGDEAQSTVSRRLLELASDLRGDPTTDLLFVLEDGRTLQSPVAASPHQAAGGGRRHDQRCPGDARESFPSSAFRIPAMSIFFIRSAASMALWDLSGSGSLIASINVGLSLSANTTHL